MVVPAVGTLGRACVVGRSGGPEIGKTIHWSEVGRRANSRLAYIVAIMQHY